MYETNEYPTQGATYRSGADRRRKWLAASGTIAAALVLLLVILVANQVRSNQAGAALGLGTPSPTPSAEPSGDPTETEAPAQAGPGPGGEGGSGTGTNAGGSDQNSTSGGDGGQPDSEEPDSEEPDSEQPEPEKPVAPLAIDATITDVTPNGHCSATGTITVDGGEYPVTVTFQWRALAVGEGWDGVPVSPVQKHTFDQPGGISIQTNQLPEDGTNVFLIVTAPKEAGSGLANYDGCSGQGGGGIIIDS